MSISVYSEPVAIAELQWRMQMLVITLGKLFTRERVIGSDPAATVLFLSAQGDQSGPATFDVSPHQSMRLDNSQVIGILPFWKNLAYSPWIKCIIAHSCCVPQ